ncbi:8246_t:CDS:2 [Cetraspora pellucida]|uniref:8246_t:CDS:1 n=1 Tax=Cetraspora pellucida TaxID=1433469 RepID=A0A9N9EJW8_9GLOM|nr:8246_t:CDS:2 [Cetraspora pellucida]
MNPSNLITSELLLIQVQVQDPDILELILQEITAEFKKVTIEVAAAVRSPIYETNLVCVDNFHKDIEEDPFDLGYLYKIATSWHDRIKNNLVYWNKETHLDESLFSCSSNSLKAKTIAWLSIANLDSLNVAIQDTHKIEAKEYYNKKNERDKAYNIPVATQNFKLINMKVMTTQAFTITRTTTTHCHIRIKENLIVAILNLDVTISIMSNKIAEKLQLKINEPSTTMVIVANKAKTKALEK